MVGGGDEQSVAVRRGACDLQRPERTAGPSSIFDHNRLTELLGERIGDEPAQDVDARTGVEGNYGSDDFIPGPIVSRSSTGKCRRSGNRRTKLKKTAAAVGHVVPQWGSADVKQQTARAAGLSPYVNGYLVDPPRGRLRDLQSIVVLPSAAPVPSQIYSHQR